VEYLGTVARREGIPLMLDPAPARELPASLLECVEWLTPNETETRTLLGGASTELRTEDLEDAARCLMQSGSRHVLLKLGERGCYVALASGERVHIPAYRVKALDTTAAGDAFNGAFATALVQGADPIRGVRWASAVAAISVTRAGAQPSMPTRKEVEAFLGCEQN
jgi:ribokinase